MCHTQSAVLFPGPLAPALALHAISSLPPPPLWRTFPSIDEATNIWYTCQGAVTSGNRVTLKLGDKRLVKISFWSAKLVHFLKKDKSGNEKYQQEKLSEAALVLASFSSRRYDVDVAWAPGAAYPLSILWLHWLLTHWWRASCRPGSMAVYVTGSWCTSQLGFLCRSKSGSQDRYHPHSKPSMTLAPDSTTQIWDSTLALPLGYKKPWANPVWCKQCCIMCEHARVKDFYLLIKGLIWKLNDLLGIQYLAHKALS